MNYWQREDTERKLPDSFSKEFKFTPTQRHFLIKENVSPGEMFCSNKHMASNVRKTKLGSHRI